MRCAGALSFFGNQRGIRGIRDIRAIRDLRESGGIRDIRGIRDGGASVESGGVVNLCNLID